MVSITLLSSFDAADVDYAMPFLLTLPLDITLPAGGAYIHFLLIFSPYHMMSLRYVC